MWTVMRCASLAVFRADRRENGSLPAATRPNKPEQHCQRDNLSVPLTIIIELAGIPSLSEFIKTHAEVLPGKDLPSSPETLFR